MGGWALDFLERRLMMFLKWQRDVADLGLGDRCFFSKELVYDVTVTLSGLVLWVNWLDTQYPGIEVRANVASTDPTENSFSTQRSVGSATNPNAVQV